MVTLRMVDPNTAFPRVFSLAPVALGQEKARVEKCTGLRNSIATAAANRAR